MNNKPKNKWVALILCVFTVFGHKFYEGKFGMGLLYLFTMGLFGIGWIVDIIALLSKPTTYFVSPPNNVIPASHFNGVPVAMPTRTVAPKAPTSNAVSDEERKQRREAFLAQKRAEFAKNLSDIPRVQIALSDEKINRRPASDMPEIKFTNITRATNIGSLFPLVAIDVETTGIQICGNDIIEVSAIKYDVGFTPVSCFTTLLKPRGPIPAEASAVNNITDDMVADCPLFYAVAPAFSEYISGCNIVGHNALFDLKFLFVCGATLPEKVRYYDTLDLAKKTLTACGNKKYDHRIGEYVEIDEWDVYDYKLVTLCEHYGIYRDDAHRSLSDCYATAKIFENLIDDKTA